MPNATSALGQSSVVGAGPVDTGTNGANAYSTGGASADNTAGMGPDGTLLPTATGYSYNTTYQNGSVTTITSTSTAITVITTTVANS
jgi:hypothetical protein